jgi:hypothetical protein
LAAEARDPAALRKSIEDSAAVGGGLWLSYLFVLFYLGLQLGVGHITDADERLSGHRRNAKPHRNRRSISCSSRTSTEAPLLR